MGPSQKDSSLTTKKLPKNCWAPSMSTKTSSDLVTPKSSLKPVSWVPWKKCETIDYLLSSLVFKPLFELRPKKLSLLLDSRDENLLESFSPTSDLTCLLRIGNG